MIYGKNIYQIANDRKSFYIFAECLERKVNAIGMWRGIWVMKKPKSIGGKKVK